MRVLHVFKTYYPDSFGGVEQVIRQIALSSRPLGVESRVFTLSKATRSTRTSLADDVEVVQAPSNIELASTPFSFSAFRPFLQATAWADVVHYHYPWPFGDLLHLAAHPGKPAVVTYHSDVVKQKVLFQVYRPLMRRFLGSVNAIVATSPNYVQSSRILSSYHDKVAVIPIGIQEASYPEPTAERLAYWRDRLGTNFFLFVGVIRYYKGLHILLDAVAQTRLNVVIVGGGPMEHELRQQAARLKLNNVHFLGALPEEDKVALLRICHAVVFPSHLRSEAYGITLLEGAMYGKPLISAEIGTGSSFINQDGQTGYVVAPNDPSAFRAAMEALEKFPDRALEMGKYARRRFEEKFTADKMAVSYVELYRQVAGTASSHQLKGA